MVIGGCSSMQSAILPWCLLCSCFPLPSLLPCFLFGLRSPGHPFFCLHYPFLCLMFSVCIFLSSNFSQSPAVSLQSIFLSLWTLSLLFFFPLFTLSSLCLFPFLSQMGVCILLCRQWQVTPARSGVRLAPRNSWRRRTFGCWVSRRRGVKQKPYRFRLIHMEMVGGTLSKSPTIIPIGKITCRCIHCQCMV